MGWLALCVTLVTASNITSVEKVQYHALMDPMDKSALRPKMDEPPAATPSAGFAIVGATVVLFSVAGLLVAAFVQHRRRCVDVPV